MKKGTYTHIEHDAAEPAAPGPEPGAPPEAESRVAIPTGDPPPAPAAAQGSPPEAGGLTVVPVGMPLDQQLVEEAKRRSESIVRQAQLEAKRMVEESKVHCQNALQQAEREGFETGRQKGYEVSMAELATLIQYARQMLIDTVYGREKVLRSCEGEIARLALRVAERVTATMVTVDPQVIKNQVTQALDRVKDREHITVRVNPQDLDVVRARRDLFTKLLEGPKTFEIAADPKVDRGGAIIETNLGNVDARVGTQLQALEMAFAEVEKRQQDEWEQAALLASQQVAAQGLPADLPAPSAFGGHGEAYGNVPPPPPSPMPQGAPLSESQESMGAYAPPAEAAVGIPDDAPMDRTIAVEGAAT